MTECPVPLAFEWHWRGKGWGCGGVFSVFLTSRSAGVIIFSLMFQSIGEEGFAYKNEKFKCSHWSFKIELKPSHGVYGSIYSLLFFCQREFSHSPGYKEVQLNRFFLHFPADLNRTKIVVGCWDFKNKKKIFLLLHSFKSRLINFWK